ncbi:MAG: hypothetical protein WED04_07990 [Promethearchaeati archaeon SRVP18_Atabeyarchaeia-1]
MSANELRKVRESPGESKADSWILNDLPEKLVEDWYSNFVYSEFDMQAAAYYWLRKYFENERSERWFLRSQPLIELSHGPTKEDTFVKPDITIYKGTQLVDAIELKCQLDGLQIPSINKDLEKLRTLKTDLRHAYMFVLYDDELSGDFIERRVAREEWMKNYLTFVWANVRRHNNGRMRNNYSSQRKKWDIYWRR